MGVTGELLIGGDGLARGYLNRPELTAERFIPDPFAENKAARVYKTGDLCQWRSDGTIDCLGRNDRQVKIRGCRIELGDIEAALASHPGVKQAVTKVVDGTGGEKTLIGYVVASGVQPQELRTYLAERLPEYMLPSLYVNLTELPLTPNRKVDWNALPVPNGANTMAAERSCTSPRTVVEKKVSEIAARLLGLEQIAVGDNFFLIGGHSLFCTQLIARIRDHFGVELPLRSVFESPTPAQLAQEIETAIATKIGAMSADEVEHALKQANSGGGQE
jgi:acyl carrier protein